MARVFAILVLAFPALAQSPLLHPQQIPWSTYAYGPQHTALSPTPGQPLSRVLWQMPVDLSPQLTNGELYIHYGSPLVTPRNTVIVPVKAGATGNFRVEAHRGTDGSLLWALSSDYVSPPAAWVPVFGPTLAGERLYFPGLGAAVYYRDGVDSATGPSGVFPFHDTSAAITTPLTTDSAGNVYFGFQGNSGGGIARLSTAGSEVWTLASTAAADSTMTQVIYNCAPALSWDERTVYIAVSNGGVGYLVSLDSTTLAPVLRVRLKDPSDGGDALLSDSGSATPVVGPDGDVYFGVLEDRLGSNHARGWLLHFDGTLAQSKTPGAFGWDDTPSIVPAEIVAAYHGTSAYLLMSKYNDYVEAGGTGLNRIAILDPNATEADPVTGVTVMKEVQSIAGLTASGPAPQVKEWCINSAAVDPWTRTAIAGAEDGKLYRWDLTSNTFSEIITLTPGIGEAYTPTLIGGNGVVYAINDGILFAVGVSGAAPAKATHPL
jgi:hypothetical protein